MHTRCPRAEEPDDVVLPKPRCVVVIKMRISEQLRSQDHTLVTKSHLPFEYTTPITQLYCTQTSSPQILHKILTISKWAAFSPRPAEISTAAASTQPHPTLDPPREWKSSTFTTTTDTTHLSCLCPWSAVTARAATQGRRGGEGGTIDSMMEGRQI